VGKRLVVLLLVAINAAAFFVPLPQAIILIAITSVILFSTEVIAPVYTSFILIILLFFHVPTADQLVALYGFQSPVVFFLIAVIGVGVALAHSAPGQWFLYQLSKVVIRSSLPLPFLLLLSFIPLSLFLPSSITRNAMLYPLMQQFIGQHKLQREARRVYLTLGVLNPLSSSAILTGGLSSLITASLLGGFTWGKWFLYMAIPYYTVMLLGMGYILIRYPIRAQIKGQDQKNTAIDQEDDASREFEQELLPQEMMKKPAFAREDWVILFTLVLMVGLWVSDSLHHLQPVVPALIGLMVLCLFTRSLNWDDIKRSSAWDNVMILASLLSLVEAMNRYGVLSLVAKELGDVFPDDWSNPFLLVLIVGFTILFNVFIPNITVCVTFLVPLFAQISLKIGLDPVLVGLVIAMVIDGIKFYPTQSTPLLMVYNGRDFTVRDVSQMGIAMTLLFLCALFGVIIPYWGWLGLSL
jgi:di/tricarboxylate transporter